MTTDRLRTSPRARTQYYQEMYRPTTMQIVRETAYLNRKARSGKKGGSGVSLPKTMDVLDFAPMDEAGYGSVPQVCCCCNVVWMHLCTYIQRTAVMYACKP